MWWLISFDDEGVRYGLLTGKEYIVGRKDGDIVVPADQSMSRKHASLKVHLPEAHMAHPELLPELLLTDTSKLGTMLQDDRFRAETRNVINGNEILFGTGGESKFRALYEPCVITTSCLETAAKRSIRPCIAKLGAHLVADWRKHCSLLIMSSLSVTIKVICALISQKHIVTPQYLEDLLKAVKAKVKLPKANDYIPPLAESQVNPAEVSFKQNPARRTLLRGKIFIFLAQKQFKKLAVAVDLAGGMPMLMEEGADDGADDLLTAPHSCVMHTEPDPAAMSQNAAHWAASVIRCLKQKGLRSIQDSELGYAVLYASTERYCNPAVDPDDFLARAPPSQSLSQMPPLEPQSQHPVIIKQERSSQSSVAQGTQRKRRRAEAESGESAAATALPPSKRVNVTAPTIEVKPEPATPKPVPARRQSPAPAPVPTSPEPRMSGRKHSPAPKQDGRRSSSPSPPRRKSRQANVASPSPRSTRRQAEPASSASNVDTSPARSRKNAHVPPPARSIVLETSPAKARKETRREKVAIKDDFDDFDFDSVPTRRNKGRGKGGRVGAAGDGGVQFEPLDVAVTAETTTNDDFDAVPSRRGKKRRTEEEDNVTLTETAAKRLRDEAAAEDIDLFDETPSRKKRKGGGGWGGSTLREDDIDLFAASPSPKKRHGASAVATDDLDLFDEIPSRKHRFGGKKNDDDDEEEEEEEEDAAEQRRKKNVVFSDDEENFDEAISMVHDEFDLVPSRRKGKRGTTQDAAAAADEVIDTADRDDTAAKHTASTARELSQAPPIDNTGFLSAARPIGEQVKVDPDRIVPNDELTGGMDVAEVSLVARRPGYKNAAKKKSAAECNVWKGQAIKNFKSFKKVGKAALTLPRIIGGSDLVTHDNKPHKEMEVWLREAAESDVQNTRVEREASAMFDWEPPTRKKGRR